MNPNTTIQTPFEKRTLFLISQVGSNPVSTVMIQNTLAQTLTISAITTGKTKVELSTPLVRAYTTIRVSQCLQGLTGMLTVVPHYNGDNKLDYFTIATSDAGTYYNGELESTPIEIVSWDLESIPPAP